MRRRSTSSITAVWKICQSDFHLLRKSVRKFPAADRASKRAAMSPPSPLVTPSCSSLVLAFTFCEHKQKVTCSALKLPQQRQPWAITVSPFSRKRKKEVRTARGRARERERGRMHLTVSAKDIIIIVIISIGLAKNNNNNNND